MMPALSISEVFHDVFGLTALSWLPWLAVLKAAFAEPLDADEREVFNALANNRPLPLARVKELIAIAGRRSGKSRLAALLAIYIALFIDHSSKLAPGETGYILVLSPTKDQSRVIFDYCLGFLQANPLLWQQVVHLTADEITLANKIVIKVQPANYRTLRGRTLLAVILEEAAFFRDENSANPDLEIYRAVTPALATTGGMVILISTAYRKTGLLFTKFRDHYAKDSDILVIKATTKALNPSFDQSVIDRAHKDDPLSARAEFDSEFRVDIQSLLPDDVIDSAIDTLRPLELPPHSDIQYVAFTDASAGRHDAFALCIGHKQDDTFICDVIRARRAPFDPNGVAKEFAQLAKDYRVTSITGDNYAGEWVAQAFKTTGLIYKRSEPTKSQLYLEAVPHFMRGAISIPDNPILIRELRLLERKTAPSGKDRVDHPSGAGSSDDLANALAGAIYLAMTKRKFSAEAVFGSYSISNGAPLGSPNPGPEGGSYELPQPIYGPNGQVTYGFEREAETQSSALFHLADFRR